MQSNPDRRAVSQARVTRASFTDQATHAAKRTSTVANSLLSTFQAFFAHRAARKMLLSSPAVCRTNANDLHLCLQPAVELIAFDGERDVPGRAGKLFFRAAEIDCLHESASRSEVQPEMLVLEHSGRPGRCDHSRRKDWLRISHSARLEQFLLFEKREGDLFDGQLRVKVQFWRKDFVIYSFAGGNLERAAKVFKSVLVHRNARSHLVSPEFFQMAGALSQGFDKRKAFDASSAALAKPALAETHQQSGSVMLPHDAGGDNPKDAVMPIRASRHYAGVV